MRSRVWVLKIVLRVERAMRELRTVPSNVDVVFIPGVGAGDLPAASGRGLKHRAVARQVQSIRAVDVLKLFFARGSF